jgi:hypothetical protein
LRAILKEHWKEKGRCREQWTYVPELEIIPIKNIAEAEADVAVPLIESLLDSGANTMLNSFRCSIN